MEDFKAESQLIRVQRETWSCFQVFAAGAQRANWPTERPTEPLRQLLFKGGAAESEREPSSTSLDGGGSISVLCVWLRPNSFVHNVSLSPANHIQTILQLENDDLPDRSSDQISDQAKQKW